MKILELLLSPTCDLLDRVAFTKSSSVKQDVSKPDVLPSVIDHFAIVKTED